MIASTLTARGRTAQSTRHAATTGTGRSAAASPAGTRPPAGRGRRAQSCRDRTRRRPRASPWLARARPSARPLRRVADRAGRHRRHRVRPSLSGLRKRSRRSTATLPPPSRRAAASRAATAGRSLSNSESLPARPSDSAPTPAKRSASRGRSPVHSATSVRIACSARLVACRKAPGDGSTRASPKIMSGARRTMTGSADARSPQLSRARSVRSASATSASRRSRERSRRLCGRSSRSRPLSVSFTIASAAAPSGRIVARLARNGSSRALSPGRATTQVPTSTIRGTRPLVETRQHASTLATQDEVGPTPLAGRADERRLEARGVDAALLQGPRDQLDLPARVGVAPPVLQGATAAHREVRARRRFAMPRRRQHFHEIGRDSLAALVARLGLDRLARQGEGHEVAPPLEFGDAVAARADLPDVERDGQ